MKISKNVLFMSTILFLIFAINIFWIFPAQAKPTENGKLPAGAHQDNRLFQPRLAAAPGAPVYQWHTFLGGSNSEGPQKVAVDSQGSIIMTGYANGTWNGPNGEAPLIPYSSGVDMMVIKVNSAGVYQWHAFLGGSSTDFGYDIAVDTNDNIFVVGYSLAGWNGPSSQAPLNPLSGNFEIAVTKLNSAGTYQWHTFYGGATSSDVPQAVVVDHAGNVVIAGHSSVTWTGPSGQVALNPLVSGGDNHVILKLDNNGGYLWHTYYAGGAAASRIGGVDVDSANNILFSGYSITGWNGPSGALPLNAANTGYNINVVKLNSAGAYQWHTFYGADGGVNDDWSLGIAVDSTGSPIVIGYATLSWNGPSGQAPLNPFFDTQDVVVFKLNSAGVYQWHTFYGGTNVDAPSDVAVDGDDNVVLTGYSYNGWNGPDNEVPLNAFTPPDGPLPEDIMVLSLDNAGGYLWHSFYGSDNRDFGRGVAVDSAGNYVIAAECPQNWNTYNGDAPLAAYSGGGWDIVAIKFSVPAATPTPTMTSTETETSTRTPTLTTTATSTLTPTQTATETSTPTQTVTETSTPTLTQTLTETATATETATPTLTTTSTATPTHTTTATITTTLTATNTLISTSTLTATNTRTSTSTATVTATRTQTTTPTSTSVPVTVAINQAASQTDPDFASSANKAIHFTAVFSEPVTGFTGADISFSGTTLQGTLTATVSAIAPLDGTTYDVAVRGMLPKGTVFVSIPAGKVNSISRPSATNAASTSTDNNIIVDYVLVEFQSTGSKDGWLLESSETSSSGGSLNSAATTISMGDDTSDRQYRGLVDFATGSLPDTAVLFSVNLRVVEASITGTSPFTTHGLLKADVKSGFFGSAGALQTPDFEDAADKSACNFESAPEFIEAIGATYRCIVFEAAYPYINLTGSTQFRLRFATDDNDDMSADLFNIYSGDLATISQRPRLFVKYYIPPAP